jgi:hypothetical protein
MLKQNHSKIETIYLKVLLMARRFQSILITTVIGFIIFQLGLLIVINHPTFLRESLVPSIFNTSTLDILSTAMTFVGGIIIVISLTDLIKSVSKDVVGPVYAQYLETSQEIADLKKVIAGVNNTDKTIDQKTSRLCKFCGASMNGEAVYCPECDRSQI